MLLTPGQTRDLFLHALNNRYAVLAVNADSPSAILDVLEAARLCDSPVIIEASLWQLTGRSFGAGDPILGVQTYLTRVRQLAGSDRFAHTPVVFHTDHIKGPVTLEILGEAIRTGASSISLDSSSMTEEENIATAGRICDIAAQSRRDLNLEMEAGVDDGLTPLDVTSRVVEGIEARNPGALSLWAPGCGTRHGLRDGGFLSFSADHVRNQQDHASSVAGRPIGIALHGSSGLSDDQLRAAVSAGVVKVNWSSESLLIRSQTAREYYASHGWRLEPGAEGFKDAAMDNGVQAFVAERYISAVSDRIRILGSEGMSRNHGS